MAKVPTKNDNDTLPRTSTAYDKSASVRKRIAKMAERKFKTGPPKSKVKDQSSKVIPRGSRRSAAKQTGASYLRSRRGSSEPAGKAKRMSYNATM